MADSPRVKILGISGSHRHASTEWGVKLSLEAAEALGYVDTEFVTLGHRKMVPCTGCMKCFGWQHPAEAKTPYCYDSDDDTGEIMGKMMESDGFIIGTPVYTLGMTGLMRILTEKAHQFGPMSFTKFAGYLRNRPVGAITVGGVAIAGQEAVAADIWIWAIGLGMLPVGSWPTVEDPNPQASEHGGLVTTVDSRSIYAKDALSKAACRTTPPTAGSRNERALRNVGKNVAQIAMISKMGRQTFADSGLPATSPISFTNYSVKVKKGSWIQQLIDEGRVNFKPKKELVAEKNDWEGNV